MAQFHWYVHSGIADPNHHNAFVLKFIRSLIAVAVHNCAGESVESLKSG